jgi:hypothetical protein
MRFKDLGLEADATLLEVPGGGPRELSLEKALKIMRYFRPQQKVTVNSGSTRNGNDS